MKRYRTRYWQNLVEDAQILDPDFARHLRECARPMQIAYQRLMSMSDGNPVGIECRSEAREAWGFILPDVAGDAAFRVQNFDADGFYGHNCYHSLQDAVEALIGDGYRIPDPGALDRCSATLRWTIGVRRLEFRLLFDQGKLSFTEMLESMQAVTLEIGGATS